MQIGRKIKDLPDIVGVDKDKCVNCHKCISICPVKYCNNGKGDYVTVNRHTCIGCGHCIEQCSHGARFWLDDFNNFLSDCSNGQKIIAIVAPSIVSNFPETYLNINGWLKNIGVKAVFDVSFGAELTVKSYIEYLEDKKTITPIITQPCPAIVTYIEMYLPELIQYLAPIDSPMLHTIKMIRKFHPEYNDHKIAALSPCLAKKREFHETGHGDYNIGFKSIDNYFKFNNIDLTLISQEQYSNPPAQCAVGFSSPGGLLKTAEKWSPGISDCSRKIEGGTIYTYLDNLYSSIENKTAPVIIDCLNCSRGCNGGPLTVTEKIPLDDIENPIVIRIHSSDLDIEDIKKVLNKFWKPNLYNRKYSNLSINNRIIIPTEEEFTEIYESMKKTKSTDFYNCSACGYGTCENMAIAIYNNLNRLENCHFYLSEEAKTKHEEMSENEKRLRTILSTTSAGFCLTDEQFNITVINDSLCKFLNINRENVIGKDILRRSFSPCSSGQSYTSELKVERSKDVFNTFLCIANPFFDENKVLSGYFAIITNINKYR